MKRERAVAMTLAAMALGVSLASCGLHGKPKVERRKRPPMVSAARVETAPATGAPSSAAEVAAAEVVAPGIVEPWGGQVDLSAQEPGWIARILVKESDIVRQGQILAVLEEAAQERAVELARAELTEASARAGFAGAAAARITRLHAAAMVADNEADRATADALEQAAAVDRARARLRLAQANLARRRLAAPRSGTILLSRFHTGEFYDPGAGPLFVLGDLSRLQVRLEVDEIDASDVQSGASCALYSDGGSRLAEGTVVRLAPQMGRRGLALESPTARADVRVREVFVEISPPAALVPGQRVWAHMPRVSGRERT